MVRSLMVIQMFSNVLLKKIVKLSLSVCPRVGNRPLREKKKWQIPKVGGGGRLTFRTGPYITFCVRKAQKVWQKPDWYMRNNYFKKMALNSAQTFRMLSSPKFANFQVSNRMRDRTNST